MMFVIIGFLFFDPKPKTLNFFGGDAAAWGLY